MCRNPIIRLATIDDAQVISELILPLATTFIAHEFSAAGQRNLLRSMEPDAIEGFFHAGHRYHVAELHDDGCTVSIETVDYEFQKGGNQMMRIQR